MACIYYQMAPKAPAHTLGTDRYLWGQLPTNFRLPTRPRTRIPKKIKKGATYNL